MSPPVVLSTTLVSDVTTNTWQTSPGAVTVPVPTGLQDGDTVTILAYSQLAGSSWTGSGFVAQYHATQASTRGFYLLTRKVTNAAADIAGVNYSITPSGNARGGAICTRSPVISVTPIDATATDVYSASASSTVTVPTLTVSHPDADVLLCWFGNGTGGVTASVSGAPTGYTVVTQTNVNVSGSTSSLGILQGNPGSGATGAQVITLSASMASSGGFAISLAPTPSPTGVASAGSVGTPTVTVSGGGQTVAPTGVASAGSVGTPTVSSGQSVTPNGVASAETVGTPSVTSWVDQWLAQSVFYCAHRDGCWGTYGEETLAGYAFAAGWNAKLAFEVSVWKTTDGVWVLSHDQTTGRVFSGTSMDITASTWSALSAKTTLVGGNPIARLDDLLTAQANGIRVFLIDNKGQQTPSVLLDLLDSYGGKARFIAKGYITSTTWADAASARGYKTWGYGFQADVTRTSDSVIGGTPNNYSVNQSHWNLLSMDQAAVTAAWTYTLSFGKPIISDELATAAQKATALSQGATGIMASDITQTVPSLITVSPNGVASAGAVGSPSASGGTVVVTLTGVPSAGAVGTPSVGISGGGTAQLIYQKTAPSTWTVMTVYQKSGTGTWVPQVIRRL